MKKHVVNELEFHYICIIQVSNLHFLGTLVINYIYFIFCADHYQNSSYPRKTQLWSLFAIVVSLFVEPIFKTQTI